MVRHCQGSTPRKGIFAAGSPTTGPNADKSRGAIDYIVLPLHARPPLGTCVSSAACRDTRRIISHYLVIILRRLFIHWAHPSDVQMCIVRWIQNNIYGSCAIFIQLQQRSYRPSHNRRATNQDREAPPELSQREPGG